MKFNLSKVRQLYIAGKLAFMVSAIYTILLMISGVGGLIAGTLAMATAVLFEYGKMLFVGESLGKTQHHIVMKYFMGCLAVILVLASMVASQAFLFNSTKGKIKDNEIKSFKYTQASKAIESRQNKIDNADPDFITATMKLQKEQDLAVAELDKMIKSGDLDTGEIGGYESYFNAVAKIVNKSRIQKISGTDISFWFFMILATLFEIVCVLFHYLYVHERDTYGETFVNRFTTKQKKEFYDALKKKKDGTLKNVGQVANGFLKVGKGLGYSEKEARALHASLVVDEWLKTESKSSILLK